MGMKTNYDRDWCVFWFSLMIITKLWSSLPAIHQSCDINNNVF